MATEYPKTIKAFQAKLFRQKIDTSEGVKWVWYDRVDAELVQHEDGSFAVVAWNATGNVLNARIFSETPKSTIHHSNNKNVLFFVNNVASYDELNRVFLFLFDDEEEAIRFEEAYNTLITISPAVDENTAPILEETGESTQAFPHNPEMPFGISK